VSCTDGLDAGRLLGVEIQAAGNSNLKEFADIISKCRKFTLPIPGRCGGKTESWLSPAVIFTGGGKLSDLQWIMFLDERSNCMVATI
jgi:hypothetical protein